MPSSALISLRQTCCGSKQFPLICNFYRSPSLPPTPLKPTPATSLIPHHYPAGANPTQTHTCARSHGERSPLRVTVCRVDAVTCQCHPAEPEKNCSVTSRRMPAALVGSTPFTWRRCRTCSWDGGDRRTQSGRWEDPSGLAASLNIENEWEATLGVTPFITSLLPLFFQCTPTFFFFFFFCPTRQRQLLWCLINLVGVFYTF